MPCHSVQAHSALSIHSLLSSLYVVMGVLQHSMFGHKLSITRAADRFRRDLFVYLVDLHRLAMWNFGD